MDDVATSVAVTADRWLLLIHQLPAGSFLGRPATSNGSPSRMSLVGQKATSAGDRTTSALPPRTDIAGREREVRFVPRLCENVREQRMRRIVFSLLLFGLRLPMLFFFLFNVIETNFLRASSTLEFSHRLDPNRELPFEIACVNKGSLSQSQGWVDCCWRRVSYVSPKDDPRRRHSSDGKDDHEHLPSRSRRLAWRLVLQASGAAIALLAVRTCETN